MQVDTMMITETSIKHHDPKLIFQKTLLREKIYLRNFKIGDKKTNA